MKFGIFILSHIPKNSILRFIFKINGLKRLVFGYCPLCNSDAPDMYECNICESFHLYNRYDYPTKELKKQWYNKFKSLLNGVTYK